MRCGRCSFRASPDVLRLVCCAACDETSTCVCPAVWEGACTFDGFCGVCGEVRRARELRERAYFLCHACWNMFRDMVKGKMTQRYVSETLWRGAWTAGDTAFLHHEFRLVPTDDTLVTASYDPKVKRSNRADFTVVPVGGGPALFRVEVKSGPGRPGESMREFQLDASDYHALREASSAGPHTVPVLLVHVQREEDVSMLPSLGWKCSGAWAVWAHDMCSFFSGYRRRNSGGACNSSNGQKLALMFSCDMFRDVSSSLPVDMIMPPIMQLTCMAVRPTAMPRVISDVHYRQCEVITKRGTRCSRMVADMPGVQGGSGECMCGYHAKRERSVDDGDIFAESEGSWKRRRAAESVPSTPADDDKTNDLEHDPNEH